MREQTSKHLSLFSKLVNLHKRLISASQYQEYTLIIIQKWRWFVRAWLNAGLLTGWRGWASEIGAAGRVIRRVWSQETPSGCYRLCQLCCLSSGISHSLQMRGCNKEVVVVVVVQEQDMNTQRQAGRREGRQAGRQRSESKPAQSTETRQETGVRQSNILWVHAHCFSSQTLRPIEVLFGLNKWVDTSEGCFSAVNSYLRYLAHTCSKPFIANKRTGSGTVTYKANLLVGTRIEAELAELWLLLKDINFTTCRNVYEEHFWVFRILAIKMSPYDHHHHAYLFAMFY